MPRGFPFFTTAPRGLPIPRYATWGRIGGSIAEADPTGDWVPVLLATGATLNTLGPDGKRAIDIHDFILDAYTTALQPAELITDVVIPLPARHSGGAYIALKR